MATRKGNGMYWKTGMDNTGLSRGAAQAKGILSTLSRQITGLDIFAGVGVAAVAAFAKISSSAWDMATDLELAMKEVQTISGATQENFEGMRDSVRALAKEVPDDAKTLSKALYQIVSAGYDGAAGLNLLEVSSKAAVAGVTDTITAADGLTTVMNAWGIAAEDATDVADVMFKTVELGKTTFGELAGSISNVAALAAASGVDFEEISAAVATLTKQGVPTAMAMTQIRSAMIGVTETLGDGWAEAMTLQEAFGEIEKRANGSQIEMKEMIGRIEGVNAVLGLTGKNALGAAKDLDAMNNSMGASAKAYNIMAEAARNQVKVMKSRWRDKLIKYGNDIIGVFGSIADAANTKETIKGLEDQQSAINSLVFELTESNTSLERRKEIVTELERLAPGITAGIDIEKGSYEDLYTAVNTYRLELEEVIKQETVGRELRRKERRKKRKAKTQAEAEIELEDYLVALDPSIVEFEGDLRQRIDEMYKRLIQKKIRDEGKKYESFSKKTLDELYQEQINYINFLVAELSVAEDRSDSALKEYDEALKEYERLQAKLKEMQEERVGSSAQGQVDPKPIIDEDVFKPIDIEDFDSYIGQLEKRYQEIQLLMEGGFDDTVFTQYSDLLEVGTFGDYLNKLLGEYADYADHTLKIELEMAKRKKAITEQNQKENAEESKARKKQLEEQKKKVQDIAKAWGEISDEIGELRQIGDTWIPEEEFQDFLAGVADFGGHLKTLANTVGLLSDTGAEIIGNIGNTVQGLAGIISGVDPIGGSLAILDSITSLTTFLIQRKEELKAEAIATNAERINKAVEKLNDELYDHLAMLGQLDGIDWLTGADQAITDVNAGIEQTVELMKELALIEERPDTGFFGRLFNTTSKFSVMTRDWIEEDFREWIKFWDEAMDSGWAKPEGYDDIVAYLEQIDNLRESLEGLEEERPEIVIGLNVDEIEDKLLQLFEDGKLAAEDFAKTFQEILRDTMVESFRQRYIQQQVAGFYDLLYQKMTTQTDKVAPALGGLSSGEIEDLQEEWERIVGEASQGWELVESWLAGLGADLDIIPDEAKDALTGGIKGITEDTAGVLAGQIMGIRFNILEQLEISQDSLNVLNEIQDNTSYNYLLTNVLSELVAIKHRLGGGR